ncbi:hypothetical protein ABZY42_08620 [Streptomyces sp. NPDC006622]|uniref:hypothetical protein n=1 Tax=Streptomyces sp. NPDC006622 TaxID=3155459 RepID=UPI0033B5AE08
MLFHLSLCTRQEQARTLGRLTKEARRRPGHVAGRLSPALTGSRQVAESGSADSGEGRRLLGWSTGGHWRRGRGRGGEVTG